MYSVLLSNYVNQFSCGHVLPAGQVEGGQGSEVSTAADTKKKRRRARKKSVLEDNYPAYLQVLEFVYFPHLAYICFTCSTA